MAAMPLPGRLWNEVLKRPEAQTPQDGIDNFILAACAAANKNLTTLFTRDWRWPMSDKAIAEANQRWGAITGAATTPRSDEKGASSAVAATKDQPFLNSLGMKFVPVPITGGPTEGKKVLFSVWETRVQDYEAFANETKREWPKPDFEQGPTHPAVNVSWEDAQAFCAWLTEREYNAGNIPANVRVRLPSDHEWSCAVGIGDREDATKTPEENNGKLVDVYPWGTQWPPPTGVGNYAGEELRPDIAAGHSFGYITGYSDTYRRTAPVGSFPPDGFGTYDLGGNVHEWCEDLYQPAGRGRVLRDGTWNSSPVDHLRSSVRFNVLPESIGSNRGFRCVLEAEETSTTGNEAPANFTTTTSNGQITITGYSGPGGHVDIPATINGLPVVAIEGAFYGNGNLTGVTLPEGLNRIGGRAFLGTRLQSVKIPSTVTSIEWQAFTGAPLTEVVIPDSVTIHFTTGILLVLDDNQRDVGQKRHWHRILGVRWLHQPDQRDDSQQRHRHRPCLRRLHQLDRDHGVRSESLFSQCGRCTVQQGSDHAPRISGGQGGQQLHDSGQRHQHRQRSIRYRERIVQ